MNDVAVVDGIPARGINMTMIKRGDTEQAIPWQVPALAATCALEEQRKAVYDAAALAKQ